MNSLRDEASNLETKLVEIRLSIKYPQNKDKVFVLLEGKTDIKLFRKIFSNNYTDTSSLNGKDKVMEALQTLHSENFTQVIGIKDADFEYLENAPSIDNLFITDYHDMEIEMIESNALNSIINEFSSNECHTSLLSNLKDNIYNISLEIGYARWYNEKEKTKNGNHILRFEGLNFNNFIIFWHLLTNCPQLFNCYHFRCIYNNFQIIKIKIYTISAIFIFTYINTKLFLLINSNNNSFFS